MYLTCNLDRAKYRSVSVCRLYLGNVILGSIKVPRISFNIKMNNFPLIVILFVVVVELAYGGDMMRKSIVFDKKTPDVFYCPQQKPKSFDKLYVHAKPLSKLCEFDGKPPPKGYKSDCYHDLDETEYACKEKHRIMMRLHPPGSLSEEEFSKLEENKRVIKRVIKKIKKRQE